MEIARMEAGQVPAVAALERQCFSEPWSERTLAQELENPRAAFWAASEGGRHGDEVKPPRQHPYFVDFRLHITNCNHFGRGIAV